MPFSHAPSTQFALQIDHWRSSEHLALGTMGNRNLFLRLLLPGSVLPPCVTSNQWNALLRVRLIPLDGEEVGDGGHQGMANYEIDCKTMKTVPPGFVREF